MRKNSSAGVGNDASLIPPFLSKICGFSFCKPACFGIMTKAVQIMALLINEKSCQHGTDMRTLPSMIMIRIRDFTV